MRPARALTILSTLVLVSVAPSVARGNGDPAASGPPTVFERFVLSACTPCIRESYPVGTVATPPLPPPGPARPAGSAPAGRPGEIVVEVVRAQQPGRPDWRSLALRVSLSVTTTPGGERYRLGTGLMDAADVPALAQAVGEMTRLAAATETSPAAETVDVDFHGGTLRIGVLRLRGEAVAYVQTGDLPVLMQRAVWEVPTTLYLPLAELPALAAVLGRAAATLETVRGARP
jgi:hypothetical protein